MVPRVVWKCVSELERRGLKHLPYVYEADGPSLDVQRLARQLDIAVDLVDLSDVPYYTIGSLIKRYLFETTSPLLQLETRQRYLDIVNSYSLTEMSSKVHLSCNKSSCVMIESRNYCTCCSPAINAAYVSTWCTNY